MKIIENYKGLKSCSAFSLQCCSKLEINGKIKELENQQLHWESATYLQKNKTKEQVNAPRKNTMDIKFNKYYHNNNTQITWVTGRSLSSLIAEHPSLIFMQGARDMSTTRYGCLYLNHHDLSKYLNRKSTGKPSHLLPNQSPG